MMEETVITIKIPTHIPDDLLQILGTAINEFINTNYAGILAGGKENLN